MNNDITKTIIRIIQNYCFNNSASTLSNEFVLTVSPLITSYIKSERLNLAELRKIIQKRKDFIYANDIDITSFTKGLFKKLNYELSFYSYTSFFDSMINFKRKMENGNSRAFPKDKTSEDMLRSTLAIYIQQETFCEPRSGAGNNDITVPSEKIIIETKLWNGSEYYNTGFPELEEYLDKSNYNVGYYIIFDYNQTPNQVIKENGEVYEIKYKSKLIHIMFVKMNALRPSKIYKETKKNNNT